jgi:hypothetical protein
MVSPKKIMGRTIHERSVIPTIGKYKKGFFQCLEKPFPMLGSVA